MATLRLSPQISVTSVNKNNLINGKIFILQKYMMKENLIIQS